MYIDDHEENILDDPSLRPATAQDLPGDAPAAEASTQQEPSAAEAPAEAVVETPVVSAATPAKAKKKRMWPKVTAAVLACALIGGLSGFGGSMLGRHVGAAVSGSRGGTVIYEGTGTPVTVNLSNTAGRVLSAAEVYASNVNSVVGITTQVTTNVWGQQVSAAAAGSGFVITQDGYIVTNYHVIENATSIKVQFKNGDTFDARVVGTEEENDVAVLKIDATGLTPVRLGSSSDLVVGENVVAIGNPLGEMTYSMTGGLVSALDKALTMSDGTVINVLQTDAAINSGNSGGPLFNMYGQVVGITNAKYSNNGSSQASIEGISFAIPIDDVKDIIKDLMEHGYVTGKPLVGVTLSTTNATEAAKYGRSGGAYVQSVVPGGAADKAGLRRGDIITAVDGQEIDGHAAFIEIKNNHKAGESVTLTVDREARIITLELTFDEQKPDDPLGQVPADSDSTWDDSQDDDYDYDYNYGGRGYDPFSWFGW